MLLGPGPSTRQEVVRMFGVNKMSQLGAPQSDPRVEGGNSPWSKMRKWAFVTASVVIVIVAGFWALTLRSRLHGAYMLPRGISDKHIPHELWTRRPGELGESTERWEGRFDHHIINRPVLLYQSESGNFVVSRDESHNIVAITMYEENNQVHGRWIRAAKSVDEPAILYYLTDGMWPATELDE